MTKIQEEWRNVPGMEDRLMVSSLGSVWRKHYPRERSRGPIPRPGIVKLTTKSTGHKYLFMRCPDGIKRRFYVHRLVALAFIPRVNENNEVCHKNDVPDDNRVENLYWGTKRSNALDLIRNGKNFHANKTHCIRGHEFTVENTRLVERGATVMRQCKECRANRGRRKRKS